MRPVAIVVSTSMLFMFITAFTGLAAPGMLHRYKVGDLEALSDAINEAAGLYRTPDDCWRTVHGTDGPLRPIAGVDFVRSRVVVRVYYSGRKGVTEPATKNRVIEEIDAVVNGDDRFSWAMVQLERSPDGWSPLLSCSLVTKGHRPVAKP